jgi:hypothetical protein
MSEHEYHWSPTTTTTTAPAIPTKPTKSEQKKEKWMVLCCKCGEYGTIGGGPVDSIYRPKHRYVGLYPLSPSNTVNYGRYWKHYIRHPYNSEKYHEAMIRYRNHEITSRPNGQRRCYLSSKTHYYEDGTPFCPIDLLRARHGYSLSNQSMEKLWKGKR